MTAATYRHERPALAVDCVVFGLAGDTLEVLLVERGGETFRGRWALPGGFVRIDETVDAAARRELVEETGLHDLYLEQLATFGDLHRDPRERVVSVAYFALVRRSDHPARAATDAAAVRWVPVSEATGLAFDHDLIVATALARLRGKVRWQPIGFELLPPKFTLTALQKLYETVLGTPLDKRNFRKKVLSMELLVPLDERQTGVAHRAAQLYAFDRRRYEELARDGFTFQL